MLPWPAVSSDRAPIEHVWDKMQRRLRALPNRPVTLAALDMTLVQIWNGIAQEGAGRGSEVERSLMVRWVVGSILHGVDPLSYFSFQPVLRDWCNKGRGMCYPVCGMVHIK